MRKVYLLIVGSIVSALVLSFVALQGFFLRNWRTIATFSGDEGLEIQTNPFVVPSNTWRIYYNMTRKGFKDFAHLAVAIYRADVDESDPESYYGGFSYTPSTLQTDESCGNVYEIDPRWNPGGSGDFYLKVSAIDCNWTVTVEAWS
jgi:hypothetical protein